MSCPAPLLGAKKILDDLKPGQTIEAKRLLEGMRGGEVLQLVTDCTAAIDDVPLWSRETDIELLLALGMANGAQEFYLKKH